MEGNAASSERPPGARSPEAASTKGGAHGRWMDETTHRPVRLLGGHIVVVTVLVLIAINGLLLRMSWTEREAALAAARSELREVARINTRLIDNDLNQIGRLFVGIGDELARYFPIQIPDNADILSFLERQRALMPLPGEIRVLDVDGRTLFRTGSASGGPPAAAAGDASPPHWFFTARDRSDTATRFDVMRGDADSGDAETTVVPTVAVAQRMNDIFGRFVGAIALEMTAAELSGRLTPTDADKRMRLTLTTDGDGDGDGADDADGDGDDGRAVLATTSQGYEDAGLPPTDDDARLTERMEGRDHAFVTVVSAPAAAWMTTSERNDRGRWAIGAVTTLVLGALAIHAFRQTVALGRALDRLARLTESLRWANAAKTNFLANMSHDLRTPLNAIIGFSETLLQGYLGPLRPPKAGDYLGDILTSGRHLLGLVDDVLDLSHIEAGRLELTIAPLDVVETCGECLVITRPAAQARGVTVHMETPPVPPILNGDAQRLRQAVINVLANAIRFNRAGGEVWLSVQRSEEAVIIRVEDDGIGMTAEELASAFTRFGRAPFDLSHMGGSGLGLPITQGIIDAHGGTLKLESRSGRGTVVTMTLPLAPAPGNEESAGAPPSPQVRAP